MCWGNDGGPSSTEAMALCLLSFPALCVKVGESGRVPHVPEVVQQTEEIAIHMHRGDGEFRVQNYEYVIRPSCGPQNLQLILSFEAPEDNANAMLSMYLCEREESSVRFFDREVWRNAFYGRLEANRQWKEKLGIPNFALIPSAHHIASGIERIPGFTGAVNSQSGTGTEMSAWRGWRPHCASICMYEITSEGFISQLCRKDDAIFLGVAQ